jgi:photosystem II PsbY protein
MDSRLIIVLLPLAVAGGWAVFNIGAAALGQLQRMFDRKA